MILKNEPAIQSFYSNEYIKNVVESKDKTHFKKMYGGSNRKTTFLRQRDTLLTEVDKSLI